MSSDVFNTITVRVHETMNRSDLEKRCGYLQKGTLIRLVKNCVIYRWAEIGRQLESEESSDSLSYITSEGIRGSLRVGSYANPISPHKSLISGMASTPPFSNQLEITNTGKRVWWRVYRHGTVFADTTLMFLGHMVFPWSEDGGRPLDRYIQMWQPLVPPKEHKTGSWNGPFHWNFFAADYVYKVLVPGTLGCGPLKWSTSGEGGLSIQVADRTVLATEQSESVRKVIAELSGD